jgi:hypothetical protein
MVFAIAFSQNPNYLQENDSSLIFQKKTYPSFNKYDNKLQFHFSTGASVFTSGKTTVFTKWISPGFTYQVNPKLNLHLGSLMLNGNNNQYFNSEQQNFERNNPNQVFLYISGDYQITKSIKFKATSFNELKEKNSNQNNYYYNQMGIDIKVNDNFFISADFINEKGNRPFGIYNNSMFFNANDYQGNGFFNNVMHNSFR